MVAVTLELQDNPYKSILFLYFFCIFINKVIPEENLRLIPNPCFGVYIQCLRV